MKKEYKFPENFFWGTATSAVQSEGRVSGDQKGMDIWDYSSKEYNHRFYHGITTEQVSGFYRDYREDIKKASDISLNSFRTSISWARLIPNGVGEINPEAITFYKNVFTELREKGLFVFVNLYHFDMPMALQKEGGFENKNTIEAYKNYAETCFELFGDLVDYWFTFNEPMIPAEAGYLHDRHYPYVVDFKRAAQVLHNIVVSHCEAVRVFRKKKRNNQIGIIMDVLPVYPRSSHPADMEAARMADLFYTRSLNEVILKGEYPVELIEILTEYNQLPPQVSKEELALIKATKIDLLGINYYQPRRVKAKECLVNPNGVFMPENFFDPYIMPGRRMNTSRGIEIYPKGIYDIAINIKKLYGDIPWFVSENGIGIQDEEAFIRDGIVQDDYRIEFLTEHLQWLHKAMKEGVNCKGYHMWTFVDCWSWINTFKNRYGFYRLNLETGEKTLKKSGIWFKEVIENNGFEV